MINEKGNEGDEEYKRRKMEQTEGWKKKKNIKKAMRKVKETEKRKRKKNVKSGWQRERKRKGEREK